MGACSPEEFIQLSLKGQAYSGRNSCLSSSRYVFSLTKLKYLDQTFSAGSLGWPAPEI
jgi:hypothetical protein